MRSRARGTVVSGWSVISVWLIVLLTAPQIALPASGLSESSEPATTRSDSLECDPVEFLLLMDDVDRLNADNWALSEKLRLAESPPECETGFPWSWVLGAAAGGYVLATIVSP